jgi:hypothetical protein
MQKTKGQKICRWTTYNFTPYLELRFIQLILRSSHGLFLAIGLCCKCEEGSRKHSRKDQIMTRFLHNALGLAVALGTGGLMLAVAFV